MPYTLNRDRGAAVGDIDVYVRFHPGRQFFSGSMLEKMLVYSLKPQRYEVTVPMDAAQVEIWFRGTHGVRPPQTSWDSRYGQNYWFQVVEESS
jgi:hypothetical protein